MLYADQTQFSLPLAKDQGLLLIWRLTGLIIKTKWGQSTQLFEFNSRSLI